MIRVEVQGAGPCSGLLLLTPDTAARWQAVRRRLACHQLAVLAETLLQLAEKHCSQHPPAEEMPMSDSEPTQTSGVRRGPDGGQNGSESAPAAATDTRGHADQSAHTATTGRSLDGRAQLCNAGKRNGRAKYCQRQERRLEGDQVALTSGQRAASQLTSAGQTSVTDVPVCKETGDARRLTVVTLTRSDGSLWCDPPARHVTSHIGVPQDHVTIRSGVSPDQQVSVIHNAEGSDGSVEHVTFLDPRAVPRTSTPVRDLPLGPLPGTSVRACGDQSVDGRGVYASHAFLWSTSGVEAGTERRPPARPAGSTRPCVLRRGRAICSTDGATIDGTTNVSIDDATCSAIDDVNSKRTDDAPGWLAGDVATCGAYSATIHSKDDIQVVNDTTNKDSVIPCQVKASSPSEATNSALQTAPQVAAPVESAPIKLAPPSLCAACDGEHASAGCPLLQPRCWVRDSAGSSAEGTLPACLQLDGSTVRAGPGGLAAYTLLGPLVGRPVRPEQLGDTVELKHIWEVYGEGVFLDTSDPASSSWFGLLRPAPRRSQRTLAVVTRQRRLFAVTTCHLAAGAELTFWQDDPGTVWRAKNMLKTSCGGCNVKFDHSLYYRRHCSLFHEPGAPLNIRKYYCKVCGEGVLGREQLLRHAADEHGGAGAYQCQHCGKSTVCRQYFRRLSYLELHRNHGCAANPQRTHPLCHLCGTRFCQPQKLRAHIRRMHSDSDTALSDCRCARCGRLLGSRTALRRHLREVHPTASERPQPALSCRRCDKHFQNRSNLKVHMLTHSGVKPFRCSITDCSAAFTTKQCLQQHYGRVHQLTGSSIPPILRSVPYTLRGYSGALAEAPPAARRRLRRSGAVCRADRLRFPDFSVSRDLPDPASGPRLMQDASRSELDSIEPSVALILGSGRRDTEV